MVTVCANTKRKKILTRNGGTDEDSDEAKNEN